jgi:hypothetical protein
MMGRVRFEINLISIHPMWLIEEKVIINLEDVILNCLMVPMSIDIMLVSKITLVDEIFRSIINGANFIQVNKMANVFHDILMVRGESHRWNGAAAIFVNRAMMII